MGHVNGLEWSRGYSAKPNNIHRFFTGTTYASSNLLSILLIALCFGAFPTVLHHSLCSLPKSPLREVFDMSRSHQFPSVPAPFSARCRTRSSASAKPVIVVGPHLFTQSSRNQSQSIHLFMWILHHQWNFLIVAVESGVFSCFPSTTMLNGNCSLL